MPEEKYPDYKAFKELTNDELLQKADRSLKYFKEHVSPAEGTALLLQAQLYMGELDRRENAAVADRDFRMAVRSDKMEIWVIALIGLEILLSVVGLVYAVHEGNKQQTVLEQMGKNTGDTAQILQGQGKLLQTMITNTHDTVDAVGKLQTVQDDSLTAQKSTLSSVGRMNQVLQQELNLAFTVSVHVNSDDVNKRIVITNLTKTSIYIWGGKLGDDPPARFTDERFIGPGAPYLFFLDALWDQAAVTLPKGSTKRIPLDFYLRSADDKPYIAHCYLEQRWNNDKIQVLSTTVSVKQESWPANVH
jgi:hypothetical protein